MMNMIQERRHIKNSSKNRTNYRSLSRDIQRRIRQDKQNYINKICLEIEGQKNQGNSKMMFENVRHLRDNKLQPSLKVLKDKQGNILTEGKDILHRWKEYYSEMYNDPRKTNQ